MNPKRSGMVLMVAVVFFAAVLASAWAVPASSEETAAAQPGKNDSKIKEKDEPTAAFEKNSEEKQVQKKKKFPWLLAAAGAVAVGMVVYFTLIKKPKYKLTVTCGEGALGSLTTGEYRYRKGEIVSYGFVLKPGWKNLQVLLDGQPVAAAGTIKMDRDHTLQVSMEEDMKLDVFVGDGVEGTPLTGKYKYSKGSHIKYDYILKSQWKNLLVRLDGQLVAANGTIEMDRNHILVVSAEKIDVVTLTVILGKGVLGSPTSGQYVYPKYRDVTYSYSSDFTNGYENFKLSIINRYGKGLINNSGTLRMDEDYILEGTAEYLPWATAFDEQGTWLIGEQVVGGGTNNYSVTFKRSPGEDICDGYVDMQLGQPYNHRYLVRYHRIVENGNRTVKIEWITQSWGGSNYILYKYYGIFSYERSIKGICRRETAYDGSDIISNWKMTKVN